MGTTHQVEQLKQQLRAIDARPIKKVAEAKGRQKMKAMKRLERVRTQANNIAENDTMASEDKIRSIQKLYSSSKREQKKPFVERKYVVSKKTRSSKLTPEMRRGRPAGTTGPYKMVDGRMKRDKRQMKAATKRAKSSATVRNKKRAASKSRQAQAKKQAT